MKILTVQDEGKPKKRFFKKKLKDPSLLKKYHVQFAVSKVHFQPLTHLAKKNGFTLNEFARSLLLKQYESNKEPQSNNV